VRCPPITDKGGCKVKDWMWNTRSRLDGIALLHAEIANLKAELATAKLTIADLTTAKRCGLCGSTACLNYPACARYKAERVG